MTMHFGATCYPCPVPLLGAIRYPPMSPRRTCKLLPGAAPAPPPPSPHASAPAHSLTLSRCSPWVLASGNFSLELDSGPTWLSAFSPSTLSEDIQVGNMRTFSSHMLCALKSQVQECFFCGVWGLENARICPSRPESEEEWRPRCTVGPHGHRQFCACLFSGHTQSLFFGEEGTCQCMFYIFR